MLKRYLILTALAALALTGCSTPPPAISLSPQINVTNASPQTLYPATIIVQDLRPQSFLVAIREKGEYPAKLIHSDNHLRMAIQNQLVKGWAAHGIDISNVNNQASVASEPDRHIQVQIIALSSNVNQMTLKYNSSTHVRIRVIVTTPKESITRVYSSSGTSSGSLQVNLASLTKQINQQLSDVLQNIVNDPLTLKVLQK